LLVFCRTCIIRVWTRFAMATAVSCAESCCASRERNRRNFGNECIVQMWARFFSGRRGGFKWWVSLLGDAWTCSASIGRTRDRSLLEDECAMGPVAWFLASLNGSSRDSTKTDAFFGVGAQFCTGCRCWLGQSK
jgi:hypothetical protein